MPMLASLPCSAAQLPCAHMSSTGPAHINKANPSCDSSTTPLPLTPLSEGDCLCHRHHTHSHARNTPPVLAMPTLPFHVRLHVYTSTSTRTSRTTPGLVARKSSARAFSSLQHRPAGAEGHWQNRLMSERTACTREKAGWLVHSWRSSATASSLSQLHQQVAANQVQQAGSSMKTWGKQVCRPTENKQQSGPADLVERRFVGWSRSASRRCRLSLRNDSAPAPNLQRGAPAGQCGW